MALWGTPVMIYSLSNDQYTSHHINTPDFRAYIARSSNKVASNARWLRAKAFQEHTLQAHVCNSNYSSRAEDDQRLTHIGAGAEGLLHHFLLKDPYHPQRHSRRLHHDVVPAMTRCAQRVLRRLASPKSITVNVKIIGNSAGRST